MKIKHEHIRMAMNVWAHPDGEKSTGCENYQSVFRAGNDVPGTV